MKSLLKYFKKKTEADKSMKLSNTNYSKSEDILKQITAAEESRKEGDNLLSLQYYLKLLSIDPYSTIENVAWQWVNGSWYGNSNEFHYKGWVIIKSNSNEVINLFQRASQFPRQRIKTDSDTTTKSIIEGLISFIGLPGQKPNEEILEIVNAKKKMN